MDPRLASLFLKQQQFFRRPSPLSEPPRLPDDQLSDLLPKLIDLQARRHLFQTNNKETLAALITQLEEIISHPSALVPQPVPDAPLRDFLASAVAIITDPNYAANRIPRPVHRRFGSLINDFLTYATVTTESLRKQLANLSQLALLVPPLSTHFAGHIPPSCQRRESNLILFQLDRKIRLLSRLLRAANTQYHNCFLADLDHIKLFVEHLKPLVSFPTIHKPIESLLQALSQQTAIPVPQFPRLQRLNDQLQDLLLPPPLPPRTTSRRPRCRSCSPPRLHRRSTIANANPIPIPRRSPVTRRLPLPVTIPSPPPSPPLPTPPVTPPLGPSQRANPVLFPRAGVRLYNGAIDLDWIVHHLRAGTFQVVAVIRP